MAELNFAPPVPGARPLTTYVRIPTRPARDKKGREQGAFLLGNCQRRLPSELPPEFLLPVRDEALLPILKPGDEVALSTAAIPEEGDVVLIGTIYGPELRRFEPKADGGWVGRSENPDYEDVSPAEEECWIIATMFDVVPVGLR